MSLRSYLKKVLIFCFSVSLLCLGFALHGCAGKTRTSENPKQDSITNQDGGANDKRREIPEKAISVDQKQAKDTTPSNALTWYKHVQPIIQKSCQNCHYKGGIAPFSLTTYAEVKAKASLVKWSVKSKRMPPWMPDGECLDLRHSPQLSQQEIETITKWVDGNTPMGDPKDSKEYKPKSDNLEWSDSTVDIQVDYTPPKNKLDDYHCFLTKSIADKTQQLVGFHLKPKVFEMVHHVLIYAVREDYAATLQKEKKATHWPCSSGALFNQRSLKKSSLIGVWVPGTDVIRLPKGTGMEIRKGDRLVLETHFNLSSLKKPLAERTEISVQYAKKPIQYPLQLALQVQTNLSIPAKSKDHQVKQTMNVPINVRLWGFMPHMHKLGSKFNVGIEKPNGDKKSCLVNINRWDYNWQQTYFFKSPTGVMIKANTKLHMACSFTNPTEKTITWGDRTQDEMCLNFYFISLN